MGCAGRLISCLFGLLMAAGSALAEADVPIKRLLTADEAKAWQAVGRIDMEDGGFCTGALVTPTHVLTAAHCLFNPETGRMLGASQVTFRAGWRGGQAKAQRSARRLIVHEDYNYRAIDKMQRVASDIALIELDQPIRESVIAPFERFHRPKEGDRVMVVSYARDRDDAPSLQERCHMLAGQADVLVYSCDVNYGASGSPIFVMSDARPKIASVVSAMATWREQDVALGASLGAPLDTLFNRLATTDPVFRRLSLPNSKTLPDGDTSISSQLGRETVPRHKTVMPQIGN